jgi:hypothetical protein
MLAPGQTDEKNHNEKNHNEKNHNEKNHNETNHNETKVSREPVGWRALDRTDCCSAGWNEHNRRRPAGGRTRKDYF